MFNIPFCFKQTGTYFVPLFEPKISVWRGNQYNKAIECGYQDYRIDSMADIIRENKAGME